MPDPVGPCVATPGPDGLAVTRRAWEAALQESTPARTLSNLSHVNEDGQTLAPLHGPAELALLEHLTLADPPMAGPATGWRVRQEPASRDVAGLRRELAELAAWGQDVLPLRMEALALNTESAEDRGRPGAWPRDPAALAALLDGLDLHGATLELDAGDEPTRGMALLRAWDGPSRLLVDWTQPALLAGRRPGPQAAAELAELWRGPLAERVLLKISGTAAHEAGATAGQELALWLAAWVSCLRELEVAGAPLDEAVARSVHELAAGHEIFETIAKLRAARLLAARVLEAAGLPPASRAIRLWARGSRRSLTRREPWTNLLRATLQGFAAGVGGAESLHLPGMEGSDDARRLAFNTQVILREEALLGRVADPARGSCHVEVLTARAAEAAWALFQRIEAEGGLWEALTAGLPQGWIRVSREARQERLQHGGACLVGTSAFLDPEGTAGETPLSTVGAPDPAGGGDFAPLTPHFLADDFQDLPSREECP